MTGPLVLERPLKSFILHGQADIEDMIWEVDDDCDKAVSWAEFQAMFTRCRNDKSGAQSLPS